MGLVKKTSIESYWNHGEMLEHHIWALTCLRIIFKIFSQNFMLQIILLMYLKIDLAMTPFLCKTNDSNDRNDRKNRATNLGGT